MSGLGSRAMSPQDDVCTSGCASSFSCRLFLCGRCRRQVLVCRRCDRGQVYCGPDCALEKRRSSQREARRRYQATDRGRQMHADRSRKYRARGRRVTDQGPAPGTTPSRQPETARPAAMAAQPPVMIAAGRVTACYRCGDPVFDMVRLSPIRRPCRRPIDDRSSRPVRRRRH
jgi:hypothetical protein